jgi:2-phospho-L-lactate guanylyltransferase
MRAWAVVPIKARERAKERLAAWLDATERAELVDAMLSDVLAALCGARGLAGAAVLSSDPKALAVARAWGVEALGEPAPLGYREAADEAARLAARRGCDALLVLPADVPLITPRDVDDLLAVAAEQSRGIVLCPDRLTAGTNALVRRPPAVLEAQFGAASLHRHQQQARALGLHCKVWNNANLALDVDTVDDLRLLLTRGGGPATRRTLARLAISTRIAAPTPALATR